MSPAAITIVPSLPAPSPPLLFSAESDALTMIGRRTPRLLPGVVRACSAVAELSDDSAGTCPLVPARSLSVGFGLADSTSDNSGVIVAGAALGLGPGAGVGAGVYSAAAEFDAAARASVES